MLYTLKNEDLTVKINSYGAELSSVFSNKKQFEFMWQGDERFWKEHAPTLFPFCGRNFDNKYIYDGKTYEMKIHGFAKRKEFSVIKSNDSFLSLTLSDDQETYSIYPFAFKLIVEFELIKNSLKITYKIINTNNKTIYFAYGFHPGFNVPINNVGSFDDYYLEFSRIEYKKRKLFGGFDAFGDDDVKFVGKKFPLTYTTFDIDHFYRNKSDIVTLKSDLNNNFIKVKFENMTSLGLWKVPDKDANYVCIEPWCGFPGPYGKSRILEEDKEMIALPVSDEHQNCICIEFGVD